MAVAMIAGMPAMVRSRFSTPTIGREWMVGEVGTARGPGRPGRHRHRPRRAVAGPHQPGHARSTPPQPVRVVSIDGLLLEVEPLEGAAKDHRDAPLSGQIPLMGFAPAAAARHARERRPCTAPAGL